MKIITKAAAYVQKIDLEILKYTLHYLPQSISSKIFENCELDVDDFNKYDFFKFEDEKDIEFFKSIDWLIDYNSVRDLTNEEITKIGRDYVEQRDQIAKKLYTASDYEEYNDILFQYKLINYQITSLNDISDFKNGLLKINLPDDIDHSRDFIQEKVVRKIIELIFNKKGKN